MTDPLDPLEVYNPEHKLLPTQWVEAARDDTEPSEAEKDTVKKIIVVTLAAVLAAKALGWDHLGQRWEQTGRFNATEFDADISAQVRRQLERKLVPILSGVLLLSHRGMVESTGIMVGSTAVLDQVAAAWARGYTRRVTKDFADHSAEAIAAQLPEWRGRMLPAGGMALRARDLYGLDARAAAAVLNYINQPKRTKDSGQLTDKYLHARAERNAGVWTWAAVNGGRKLYYTQAMAEGRLPRSTRVIWITAKDERVCPVCAPMDTVSVAFNERFHVAGANATTPPIHPLCRCIITIDNHLAPEGTFTHKVDSVAHFLALAGKTIFH